MPWSPEQISVVDEALFVTSTPGYHPDDVERLRTRVLVAMRRGMPMPDLDAMALRRKAHRGASLAQVDGLLTVLTVWSAITPVEDPVAARRRERDEELAAVAAESDAGADLAAWTPEQMDYVREKRFRRVPRHQLSYDENDVDDFLDSVVIAMRRGIELPDPKYARFDRSGLRRGYDPKEVDDFLDEIATMTPEG